MTKALCFALILSLVASAASAQTATCHSRATDKSLHGAAETSFLKKCEKDASASCTASAAEKKLRGAAKSSFVKKCVKDAVGG